MKSIIIFLSLLFLTGCFDRQSKTYYDPRGNQAPQVNTAPEISLLGPLVITLEAGDFFIDPGFLATDLEDGDISGDVQISSNIDTNSLGSYTITYSVIDSNGEETTLTRTVNIVDTLPPEISLNGASTITIEAGSSFSDPGALALDYFEGDLSLNIVVGGNLNTSILGSYTVSYNVSDSSGNNATEKVRTVNVVDSLPPVLSLIGSGVINHEAGTPYSDQGATALDGFEGNLSGSIIVSGSVNTNQVGSYTLTYNVSDSSGNMATAITRTINVMDNTNPVITLSGGDVTVEYQGSYIEPGYSAFDSLDGDLTSSVVISGSVNTSVLGFYTLSYNVSDSNSNSATEKSRTVYVLDTTPPVITLSGLASQTLEVGGTYSESGFSASDNYDGDLTSSVSVSGSVDTNTVGTYYLYYDVQDSNGNSANQEIRTIEIVDTTAPVLTLLGDDPLTIEYGSVASYTDPGATALDSNEGDLTSSIQQTDNINLNVLGSYTVNFSVSDSYSNTATDTRVVNIVDTTIPSISLVGSSPIEVLQGESYTELGATASDNYDGDLTSSIITSGSVDNTQIGSYTITYSVMDSSSNMNSITRTVNVNPNPNLLNRSLFFVSGNKIERADVYNPANSETLVDPADYSFIQVDKPYFHKDSLFFAAKVASDWKVYRYDFDTETASEILSSHELSITSSLPAFHPRAIGDYIYFPINQGSALSDIARVHHDGTASVIELDERLRILPEGAFVFNDEYFIGGEGTNIATYKVDSSGVLTTYTEDFALRDGKEFINRDFVITHVRDTSYDFKVMVIKNDGTYQEIISAASTSVFASQGLDYPSYALFKDPDNVFRLDDSFNLTIVSGAFSVLEPINFIINDSFFYGDTLPGSDFEMYKIGLTGGISSTLVQNFNPAGDNNFSAFKDSVKNGLLISAANSGSAPGYALYTLDPTTGGFSSLVYDPLPLDDSTDIDIVEIFHKDGDTYFYSLNDLGTYDIIKIDSALNLSVVHTVSSLPSEFTYYKGPF